MCKKLSIRVGLFLCMGVFSFSFYNAVAKAAEPAAAPAYVEKDVTNGGTIEGTVKWSGPAHEAQYFAITKDVEHCGAEKKPSPRLSISSNGGVKNTVVYLANIREGKKLAELTFKPVLDQVHCVYEPHILIVPVGINLDMLSSDNVLHNVHMFGAATYNLAFPVKGQVISKKMKKAGVVEAVCDAGHYWMSSFVHVVEHPYYTVTDDEGKFKIENVPPGTYKLCAWHEGWKIKKQDEKDGKISKVIYSEPVVIEQEVKVAEKAVQTVNLELSDK